MRYFYVIVFLCLFSPSFALAQPFDQWLAAVRQEALSKGISQATVNTALSNIQPIPRIIELDRKQPEGTMTFAQYKQKVISQDRIDKGRRMLRENKAELDRAASNYGVPPEYIVALWGIETSYGSNTGGFGVVEALATLAYDGRRADYFRGELMKALRILDEGHINSENMLGSWAGAMGQNQFMPSSFFSFAVDGNGDGRRNIWTSLPDVFASTANYLSKSGWNGDQRWGREVKRPQGFPESLANKETVKSVQEWANMGFTQVNGQPLPVAVPGMRASIITPDDENGPAYMIYDNYRVIMKWNKSVYFATSVGILADAIVQ
jgi:membrane-bound lytic murein transglycosylase B